MKNRLFFLIASLLLLASCAGDGYTIKGSFPSAEDGTVVYMTAADEYFTIIDSAVINNGCFEFKDGYHDRIVRMLLVPDKAVGGPVVLENGVVEVLLGSTMERRGTDGNEILQRFMDAKEHLEALEKVTSPAYAAVMPMDKSVYDSLAAERDNARDALASYSLLAIESNVDNNLGLFLATKSYKIISAEKLAPLLAKIPSYLRNARFDVVNDYVSLRLATNRQKAATAVGKNYLNFELPNFADEKVLFSTVVGKNRYTLLQFWASWCAPCRKELPELSAVHKKYRSKGFEAVGLSLDSDANEWRDAVSALGLSWLQLCGSPGNVSEVAAAYGIDAVPANILINNKGVIIARDITPSELDALLGDSLK